MQYLISPFFLLSNNMQVSPTGLMWVMPFILASILCNTDQDGKDREWTWGKGGRAASRG